MLMAGKGTTSEATEESVALVCPNCRKVDSVETTLMGGLLVGGTDDPNRATCQRCQRTGRAGDWLLIERLRRYVARVLPLVEH